MTSENPRSVVTSDLRRVFFAISLGEITKDLNRIASRFVRKLGRNGKLSPTLPAQIHLTLRFVGDLSSSKIEELRNLPFGEGIAPFTIGIKEGVVFPPGREPRVLCLFAKEMGEGAGRLLQIRRRLDDKLEEIGVPREGREFHPHITLARVRIRPRGVPLAQLWEEEMGRGLEELKSREILVSSFSLIQSELTPKGPIYTPLGSFFLKG